jgi:hypothetical protein
MTNRIGGDFDMDAVEAFRDAYASRLMTPEDQDIDAHTGLPTSEISNTSPWIEHTGLWKYPSGKGPDEDLKQPFAPEQYYEEDEEFDDEEDTLTEEEIDALIDEILAEDILSELEEDDEPDSEDDE